MSLGNGMLRGIVGALTLTSPPLYRYPYRNSFEAFRSDWKHIGGDITSVEQSMMGEQKGEADE